MIKRETADIRSEHSKFQLKSYCTHIVSVRSNAIWVHISRVNLRGTRRKGRNSAVKSSQLSWTGQYKK